MPIVQHTRLVFSRSQGANVAILAKSETEDPRIPGTIYSAQKEIEEAAPGSKAEPIPCDVRSEEAVTKAVQRAVQRFGGIVGATHVAALRCLHLYD